MTLSVTDYHGWIRDVLAKGPEIFLPGGMPAPRPGGPVWRCVQKLQAQGNPIQQPSPPLPSEYERAARDTFSLQFDIGKLLAGAVTPFAIVRFRQEGHPGCQRATMAAMRPPSEPEA